jgi:hypothetical protein
MVLPSAEVRDEVLPDLPRRVLAGVGIEALPVTQLVVGAKAG